MGKKAVLVGCNYPGKLNALRGCANDVFKMKACLIRDLGFKEEDITILIDDDKGSCDAQPTKANILKELSEMVKSASSGDLLFFQFSGHGELLPYNQSIVAADGDSITSDDFGQVVELIPEGATLTIVADCCHSGGLIEGAKEQKGDSTLKKQQRSGSAPAIGDGFPYQNYDYVMDRMCPSDGYSYDDPEWLIFNDGSSFTSSDIVEADGVILLSACQSYEKAKEVGRRVNRDEPIGPDNPVVYYGLFTNAITSIIEEKQGDVTNLELAFKASEYLVDCMTQNPGLYCSDRLADAPFLGVEIERNLDWLKKMETKRASLEKSLEALKKKNQNPEELPLKPTKKTTLHLWGLSLNLERD